jgi:large subunit ribosomal protein L32e
MRRNIKGWPLTVSTGYKGPKIARGLHPSGYREVLVHNSQEVGAVDTKTQAIRIAHTVGRKKRAQIIAAARKKKITVLNAKEVKEATVEVEAKPEAEEKKPVEKQPSKKETTRKAATKKKAEKPTKKTSPETKAEKPRRTKKSSKMKEGAEKP